MSLNIESIISKGKAFYDELISDENGRFRSWEHCYTAFSEARKGNITYEVKDLLCLQLAFYLASWGMYRGSSFLLQKDYRVHIQAIHELFDKKNNPLWGIACEELLKKENQETLLELNTKLSSIYYKIRNSVKENSPQMDISSTLITKILMGTLGCVPAYDRFFIDGIKVCKVSTGNYNLQSIMKLVQFYQKHYDQLENCRAIMSVNGVNYPQMKVLDMCFWKIGYDNELMKNENGGVK